MDSEKFCIDLLQFVVGVFNCYLQQKTKVHKVLITAAILLIQVHFSGCLQYCLCFSFKCELYETPDASGALPLSFIDYSLIYRSISFFIEFAQLFQ